MSHNEKRRIPVHHFNSYKSSVIGSIALLTLHHDVSGLHSRVFRLRITRMRRQRADLTSRVNDAAAEQLALEEEAAGLKLALGNITSSLHQMSPTDAGPSPEPDQTPPTDRTTRVSVDRTCGAWMGL